MQARLFAEGTIPEHATVEWYQSRERAPHLEEHPHIGRLHQAAELVHQAIASGAGSVVDFGAGDGGLLSLLANADRWADIAAWGYDLQPSNIEGARQRGVDVQLGDVLTGDIRWGDVAVATEMLEHLIDPHTFVRTIAGHSLFLVASSPAYETVDSHYAHHLWCWDMDGYRELVEQAGFTVTRHVLVDGFQVLLAER